MSIKLFACGGVVNCKNKNDFIDDKLKKVIKSADMAICNFEAPVEYNDMQPIQKAGPHIYQSNKSIMFLADMGFNYASIANNHIYDYGQISLEATLSEFENNDIVYVGGGVDFDSAYKTHCYEKNGLKVGLLAACENEFGCLPEDEGRGGYAWLFHHKIEDSICKLNEFCDYVVLIAHAGVEEIDFPIKEWRDRYKRLCDIGVDVVIGHHPHVPHGYEKYKNSTIFYSLGNFYFDTKNFENKSDDSYSVFLNLDKNNSVSFDVVYHKKINGQTCMVSKNEVAFSLDNLNSILKDNCDERNDKMAVKLFHDYYYNFYETALGKASNNANLLSKIKSLIRRVFFPTRGLSNRHLMLLHNIRIESHRFTMQRALKLIAELNMKPPIKK
jgi:poly-gamma-glutamate synthesis protein (capsule biosynthesis protein)